MLFSLNPDRIGLIKNSQLLLLEQAIKIPKTKAIHYGLFQITKYQINWRGCQNYQMIKIF